MTDEEYQIRRKFENRNLMRELEWVSHYPPSGMSNQNKDFIKWLAMTAYDKINELEQTSVPVHDMELILDEVAKPQWIPVTERLPEEGKFVLVYGDLYPNKHDGGVIAVSKRMDWNYWQGFGRERDITHWMPLPKPPKEET